MKTEKKKIFDPKYTRIIINSGVSPQKQLVYMAKSTKKQFLLTKFRVITSILRVLGLDLHSSSTEPVNFFGAQFSLGRAQFSFVGGGTNSDLGERGSGMPPRGAGPMTQVMWAPIAGAFPCFKLNWIHHQCEEESTQCKEFWLPN